MSTVSPTQPPGRGRRTPISILAVVAVALLLVVGACGASTDPGGSSAKPALDVDAFLTSAEDLNGRGVTVEGFLLVVGSDARLCALVLESYPPQCGGGSIHVVGTIPAEVMAALDSTDDPSLAQATWGTVVIGGTVASGGPDGPTITIDKIAPLAPAG
jgi:hypothetical protein